MACKFTNNDTPICMIQGVKMSRYVYGVGGKYCSPCDRGFFVNGFHCPCCGLRMRTIPRDRKVRERFKKKHGLTEKQL